MFYLSQVHAWLGILADNLNNAYGLSQKVSKVSPQKKKHPIFYLLKWIKFNRVVYENTIKLDNEKQKKKYELQKPNLRRWLRGLFKYSQQSRISKACLYRSS